MDDILNAKKKRDEEPQAWTNSASAKDQAEIGGSTGGPCRQLGGAQAEELRRKLHDRQAKLRIELQDVRRALDLLNNDELVQKVMEVISVANK